jgi:hypothetical protein
MRFRAFDKIALPGDPKELIQLIVREIVVKPYGPKTDSKTVEKKVFKISSVKNGSRGRTRTFNPTVNSRVLYH